MISRLWHSPVRRFGVAAVLGLILFFPAASVRSQTASSPEDQINKARMAYNDRQFDRAAREYGEYLKLYPEGPDRDEAGFFQGHSLFLIRQYDQADQVFAREENLNSNYEDQVLFYRGEIASARRDYDNALIFYDRLVAEFPDSKMAPKAETRRAEVHYLVGNSYLSKNAPSLALQQFLQANPAPPDIAPLVSYKLGLCYKKLNQLDDAAKVWGDLAVSGDQTGLPASLVARYQLARLQEDRGRVNEAEVDFQALVDAAPDHFLAPLAREGLARIWAARGEVDRAMEYWTKEGSTKQLISLSDQFGQAIDHYLHEEYADAVKIFETVAAKSSDPELTWKSKVWLARSLAGQGLIDRSLETYREVAVVGAVPDYVLLEYARALLPSAPEKSLELSAAIEPDSLEAAQAMEITALASFAARTDDAFTRADQYLERYSSAGGAGPVALLAGRATLAAGDYSRAERYLNLAMNVHPEPEGRVEAALGLARIYRSQSLFDSAGGVLDKARADGALALGPLEQVLAARAEADYGRGAYEKGIATYQSICDARTDCPDQVRLRLFWGKYRAGRFDQAVADLDQLIASPSERTRFTALLWRAQLLIEQDQPAEAISYVAGLTSPDALQRGLALWITARAQVGTSAWEDAVKTLSDLDRSAPGAALFAKGQILNLALKSGDSQTYLSVQPAPSEMDRENLSEESLLGAIRTRSQEQPPPQKEIEQRLEVLKVVAVKEQSVDEGTFLLAESMLKGPERQKGLDLMAGLVQKNPNLPFAKSIRFYQGEDSFMRKDWQGALSWTRDLKPEDLPPEHRFRLLYVKAQSYKMLREMENARPYYLAMVNEYPDYQARGREWLDVGVGLILCREYTAAQSALDIVISTSTDPAVQAEALYWKGMGQEGAGDLDGALKTFNQIADNYSGQGMWPATALYEAAHIYTVQEDYDQALEIYGQVQKMTRGDKKMNDQVKAKIAEVKKLKRLKEGSPFKLPGLKRGGDR